MNQKVLLIVPGVGKFIQAERDVAYGKIKKIIWKLCFFKAVYLYIRGWIELFCYAPGDAVQLHAKQPGFRHAFRQKAKEISHSYRGFQHVARLKSHVFNTLVDGADYGGAGVMGI